MESAPTLAASETISANLRTILRGVLAALGMWRLEAAHALILYRRIGGIGQQIERMLTRFRAGRLWRILHRTRVQRRCGRVAGRGPALPRRFGWLVQAGGHQAASFGSQLQTVLNAPEMIALLAASPQAGRMLRPLCRALAVELPCVQAKPREAAAESGERPPRKRRSRPAPPPFRIPWPRGALSAARRQGFGKIC